MTNDERKLASADLTLTYLASYYPDWRLVKVLANKKLIENRYDFFEDLMPQLKQSGDPDGKKTIAQEIKHGLYFDTIAQCVQYVEDLFALFLAAETPDFFIKNIVTYKAGTVTSKIKNFKADINKIEKLYWVPDSTTFSEESKRICQIGLQNLKAMTEDIVAFYISYEFFYSQYKHGLTIPMRPFGNIYTDEQLEKDQKGEFEPYLVAYDNFNLMAGEQRGTFNARHGVLMPGFTENVGPHISALSQEDNFLRFVHPPDTPFFSFNTLENHAKKVRACIQTFVANYSQQVDNRKIHRQFQLPSDYLKNEYYLGEIEVNC